MSRITVFEGEKKKGSTSNAFDDIVTEELMREYTLSFSVLNTDAITPLINERSIFLRQGQKFEITGIDSSSINGNITQITAEHISYRLNDYAIAAGYAFVGTIREIANDILSIAENINTGRRASAEFTVNECVDDENTYSFRLKNTADATARDAIITLQTLGVEIAFDNKTINIVSRRGKESGATFTYQNNLNGVRRTWQKGNGWTYEIDAVLIDGEYAIGDDITIINPDNGESFKSRIITEIRCADDPRQDKIVAGTFALDQATQAADTNRVAFEAKSLADKSLQEGERYSNVYINHQDGVVAENRAGTLRVVMNGDDCFAVQRKNSDGTWKTVTTTEEWGILTNRLSSVDDVDKFFVTIGDSELYNDSKGLCFYKKSDDGTIVKGLEITLDNKNGAVYLSSNYGIHIRNTKDNFPLHIEDKNGDDLGAIYNLKYKELTSGVNYELSFKGGMLVDYKESDFQDGMVSSFDINLKDEKTGVERNLRFKNGFLIGF